MTYDWKYLQQLYHLTNEFDDDIEEKSYIVRYDTLVSDIIEYFNIQSDILIYPAKSYAVAIIYAEMLRRHFKVDFKTVLNDPSLLYGNDKFFVPYDRNILVYDEVLSSIDMSFDDCPDQVYNTIEYFKLEFFINTYKINL